MTTTYGCHFVGYNVDFSALGYNVSVILAYINGCGNPFVYVAQYKDVEFQRGLIIFKDKLLGGVRVTSKRTTNSTMTTSTE